MLQFGEILLTPIRCFGKLQDPWISRFLCVARMDPLHLLQTSKSLIYTSTHSNCAVLSVSNAVRHTACLRSSLALQVTVGWNINTGLWNKHQLLTIKVVSTVLYPYNSDKTNAQKSKISTKIDVYSYRREQRHASFSAQVICRGLWGSNKQHTVANLLKTSWAPLNSWNFIQYSHCNFRYVLPSL